MLDLLSTKTDRTIFVDLDGALVRSDLFWESLFLAARQNPVLLAKMPGWAAKGRAHLKARLAEEIDFDAALLPYREEVVAALRLERERGRRIVLVGDANDRLAFAVARHLGLFDTVIASTERADLTPERRLRAVLEDSGERGFDYYGRGDTDLALLERAAEPTVVSPGGAGRRWQARTGAARIEDGASGWRAYAKAMRPHQWMKNVLIFVPTVLVHEFMNAGMILAGIVAFLSFSFAASSVYILNDLLDLSADRRHKTKRHRPFASGAIPIPTGLMLGAGLFAAAFALAATLPIGFMGVLAAYLVATTAYSFALKRMLLIDVLTLAGLYTARIIAGAAATGIETSFWLFAFSVFFFLSLALVKRYTELHDFGLGANRSTTGRGYVDADLDTLSQAGMASGFASVMVLALYIDSDEVMRQYSAPYFVWPLCLIVLYIIVRIWILARRGQMHDDPVVFILRDWRSQMMVAFGGVMFLAASYV